MQATMVFAKPSAPAACIIEHSQRRARRHHDRQGNTPSPRSCASDADDQMGAKVGMRHIGRTGGVDFDIETWDSVSAQVDLAVCGMFRREMPGTALSGACAISTRR
jgi:hypothetical protein